MQSLGENQEERMRQMPDVGSKVAEVILSLLSMALGESFPFTVIGTNVLRLMPRIVLCCDYVTTRLLSRNLLS